MPSRVRDFRGNRIAVYSPLDHFAVITPPGSNQVIDFKDRQPRSTVVEGADVCLARAEQLLDALPERHPSTTPKALWSFST